MVRPISTRFVSFLDRFEERMQVDCEQMKRQLIAQVDEGFGVVREMVTQLRSRFGCAGQSVSARSVQIELPDDPQVETIELDQWLKKQSVLMESSGRDVPSTSTGHKRKSSSTSRTVNNKRHKTVTTDGSNKFRCKSPGCGKSSPKDSKLAIHERIHLDIKPFSCTWPRCRYSSVTKGDVVRHVRMKHFNLPKLNKDQARLNIVDNRNPEDYVRVDDELLERRLE
jgi:hypothetical protein